MTTTGITPNSATREEHAPKGRHEARGRCDPGRPIWPTRCVAPRLAHGEHEKRIGGESDVNWPDWYAAYMVAEQWRTDLPT
jgi:hypothetical protein